MARMAQKPRVRPFELSGLARTRQKGVKKGSKMAIFDPFLTHFGQNLYRACRFSLDLGRFRGLSLQDLKKGVKKGVKNGLFLTPFWDRFWPDLGCVLRVLASKVGPEMAQKVVKKGSKMAICLLNR